MEKLINVIPLLIIMRYNIQIPDLQDLKNTYHSLSDLVKNIVSSHRFGRACIIGFIGEHYILEHGS